MTLETVLQEAFYKLVDVHMESKTVFRGYLIAIKLPVVETVMLYYVQEKHIDKYIKNQNVRWIEQLPFNFIQEIKILPQSDKEKENLLREVIAQKDIMKLS